MSSSELKQRYRPWEQGSDFHWFFDPDELRSEPELAWSSPALLGSGRDALRFAVGVGIRERGWQRLSVPDYLCQEVVADLGQLIDLRPYPCDPWTPPQLPADLSTGDVVLSVPFFGMARPIQRTGDFDLLEDHTHDPWSRWARESDAELCVASLRKTLPIPEGGVAWSPRNLPLPSAPPATRERELAATRKRGGMLLKAAYLSGAALEKSAFLDLFSRGEAMIAAGPMSGMTRTTESLLPTFPVEVWRERRRANHRALTTSLAEIDWMSPLAAMEGACPFVFAACLDTSARLDRVRQRLIREGVYPPVLWPLDETVVPVRESAKDLARRIFVLHCDVRYDTSDLERVATLVRGSGEP